MEPAGRGRVERRLAAILAADVAGYSRLIGADEGGTLERLKALRRELLDPKIAEHSGRLVKTTGDGLLVEFGSVVDALRCAVEVQREITGRNAGVPPDSRIEFRVGINVGDIVVEDGDIFGDGVNVAARLEGLAEPGGICVSARVQEDAAGKLDLAFDDIGEQQLKNIARPVRAYRVVTAAQPAIPPVSAGPPLPDKPSIAVLPFQNLSGDPEQEYFADGMVEEIITALSRIRWLFVIARNSSFTYKGQAVDVKQVGRELGVRYVLEGSVRKAAGRVRITAQLIDAGTNAHLWADRFDGSLEDVFDLQDRVASSVAGVIEPALQAAEMARATRKPTESLDAYDLYLRALAEANRLSANGMQAAVDLLKQALAIDQNYLPAIALTVWCRLLQRTHGWISATGPEVETGLHLARRAVVAGRDDPEVLCMASYALAAFAGENEIAQLGIDRALMLNPNAAQAWQLKGLVCCFSECPEQAIEALERSTRLSPLDPRSYITKFGLAMANFIAGRYREALGWVEQSLQEQPHYVPPLRYRVALLAHLDRLAEAQAALRQLLDLFPTLTMANYWATSPGYSMSGKARAAVEAGLRKAGLAEQ
jgi:TolB-like protein/class 3 adenylate cyclase/Flp pilus assembly protein TadD